MKPIAGSGQLALLWLMAGAAAQPAAVAAQAFTKQPMPLATYAPTVVASVSFGPFTTSTTLAGTAIDLYLYYVNVAHGMVKVPGTGSFALYSSGWVPGSYRLRVGLSYATTSGQVIASWFEGTTLHQYSCPLPQGPGPVTCELPFNMVSQQGSLTVLIRPTNPQGGLEVVLGQLTLDRLGTP